MFVTEGAVDVDDDVVEKLPGRVPVVVTVMEPVR